ncbi:hypothetical protein BS47DRAFT_1485158 [Hydnum rufescens UP504]|uniref:Uncharacterized protein n=1 Tax=Hydnum rufescens UP504 TaxID=1448309 RepID=A0A9P6AYC8_9AGAM|nr:hypothetical protein BS47DRAFT_1485158 [Hydnum rufescens UP504]
MTHISPTVYVFWTILSVALFGFLVSHLWKFDRFKSLRWDFEKRNGAFKRIMTYCYLTSVPTLIAYSMGMMVIKYKEGFVLIPGHGIVPKPYQLWSPQNVKWIHPLYMLLSVAWALEIVSHLEELCFWLFLVNLAPYSSWFSSIQFKIWVVGSVCSLVGLPLLTWFTREDPLKSEPITMMAGSIGSGLVTFCSLRVLWLFPAFIKRVRRAGGEPEVVIRLTVFKDLNISRTFFRFIFVISFLIISADGITRETHVNENAFATDLLATAGAIGLVVSSMFTLLIFFPRSIGREAGYTARTSFVGRRASMQLEPIVYSDRRGASRAPQVLPFTINQTRNVVVLDNDPLDPSSKSEQEKESRTWTSDTVPPPGASQPDPAPFHGPTITAHPYPSPPLVQAETLPPILKNYSSPINIVEDE